MWAERRWPPPGTAAGEPSSVLKAALDTLRVGVSRDYALIRDHLKRANRTIPFEPARSLDALVNEARVHYWVQWWKDGVWLDLDPSFADAAPGKTFASAEKPSDALPDGLFHIVGIRLRVEEHDLMLAGEADVKPAIREVLAHRARAADLSGIDVVLSHQPENWKGPSKDIQTALASALTDTGRIKPGTDDRQEPDRWHVISPEAAGHRRDGRSLRSPERSGDAKGRPHRDGGMARARVRRAGRPQRDGGAGHLRSLRKGTARFPQPPQLRRSPRADQCRRRVRRHARCVQPVLHDRSDPRRPVSEWSQGRAAGRDGAGNRRVPAAHQPDLHVDRRHDVVPLGPVEPADRAFVPASPRIAIAESSMSGGKDRISLDLRHIRSRIVGIDSRPDTVFFAAVFRGVVEGTLERVLMEYLTAGARQDGWEPEVSTSSLFERAVGENVDAILLRDGDIFPSAVSGDVHARLNDAMAAGHFVLSPQRTIAVGNGRRLAWWQIDPKTGETIAVTDEGLHQTAVCYTERTNQENGETEVVVQWVRGGRTFNSHTTYRIDQTTQYEGLIRSIEDFAERLPWNQFPFH